MNDTQHYTTTDEVDLFTIIDYFLDNWKKIALCTLLGLGISIILLFVIKPKYEVTASLDIAKVANGESNEELESVALVLSRLQSLNFRQNVAHDLIEQNIIESQKEISFIKELERATKFNTRTDLIDIKIQATESLKAKIILQTMLDKLILLQKEKYDAYSNNQISMIEQLEFNLKELEARVKPSDKVAKNDIATYQFEFVKSNEVQSIIKLKNQILLYKTNLKFPITHPTSFFGEININPKPVSPKKALTLLIGLVLGFTLCCGWTLLLTVKKQYIERNNLLKERAKL